MPLDEVEELSSLSEQAVVLALGFSPAKSLYDSESKHGRSAWIWKASHYPSQSCTEVTKPVNILTGCQKVWKQGFLTWLKPCHRQKPHFHFPLLPPCVLIPLQISVSVLSQLDSHADRKKPSHLSTDTKWIMGRDWWWRRFGVTSVMWWKLALHQPPTNFKCKQTRI